MAEPGDPIATKWSEGDFAGATTIWTADGKGVQGFSAYRQHREGDRLIIEQSAHYRDGSFDTDEAVMRVGKRLEAVSGRSIIRDAKKKPILDLRIDVAKRRISGFYTEDGKRVEVDESIDIGPGTYWGPLFNLVVKNFDANATDGKLVFQAILATPKPRVLNMELTHAGSVTISRTGGSMKTDKFTLLPTVNFLIDPIVKRLAPTTLFFLQPGSPPAMVRFDGPRNYAGQRIWLE
jgi:hypothetical protein